MSVLTLPQLLKAMLENSATDMHITTGCPPSFRVGGKVAKIKGQALDQRDTKELCYSVLTDHQKAIFEESKELDFSFSISGLARFRGNVFYQRGAVAGAFRHIPFEIPNLNDLGLPSIVEQFITKPKGLVLITGPSGSGKTTTLASMISLINERYPLHIMTIEDPVEYVHTHQRSIVNQREVGQDTKSFANALRSSLREDPDVVMIGEMRDKETIEVALNVAETGQLVVSSLHTNSAIQTISRILNVFPPDQQTQVRTQLSMVLEGIVTQALIQKKDGSGRALASEVLVPTSSVRNLIRENKLHQIPSAMQSGQEITGMCTFNQSLLRLVSSGVITLEDSLAFSPDRDELIKAAAGKGQRRAG